MFCVVGDTNKAITSSDGITWTQRTLPNSYNCRSICWSPELRMFCAVGSDIDFDNDIIIGIAE